MPIEKGFTDNWFEPTGAANDLSGIVPSLSNRPDTAEEKRSNSASTK